jgi:folate-binding protein YgfZ
MPSATLADRAVLRVSGTEARGFLQGLVTCDVESVSPTHAAYGALLSPQGKILVDFLVVETEDGDFLLDVPAMLAADFTKRLTLYRLRAKVKIEALPELCVVAVWDETAPLLAGIAPLEGPARFADPRASGLGWRVIAPKADAAAPSPADGAAYEARRIALGIPAGGRDFVYGDTFPHDANFDLIHGVDFRKGCYIGQEVVSRVQHRGSARKRVLRVRIEGDAKAGETIVVGDVVIGTLGSVAGRSGLALMRTDKAEEAIAAGHRLQAGSAGLALDPVA